MKKYYKYENNETGEGPGTNYIEVESDIVRRQIEVYGERVFWLDVQHPYRLGHRIFDRPASRLGLRLWPYIEITPEEFEGLWAKAKNSDPQ